MKTKHTPTPWSENEKGDTIYITGNPTGEIGGMRTLAMMVDTWVGHQTAANAEFIVRACNAHEQLVEALNEMLAEYRLLLKETMEPQHHQFIDDSGTIRQALAALAAAGAA